MNTADQFKDSVRTALHTLPELKAPDTLEARVIAGIGAPVRSRGPRYRLVAAASAALLMVASAYWLEPLNFHTPKPAPETNEVVQHRDQIFRLEIAEIDRALQEAYLTQVSEAQIRALWVMREQAMNNAQSEVRFSDEMLPETFNL